MHRCFQVLTKEGKDSWTEDRIKSFEDSLPTALKTQGLPPEMIWKEVKKGKIMLRNILNHARGRWILGSHEEAHCEYSLPQINNNTYNKELLLEPLQIVGELILKNKNLIKNLKQ